MLLNTLAPAEGSKKTKRRVGRGQGSGLGKMGGRGHKGQKSRSGGFHKVGFEGGQMPIQRRLPKVGFTSLKAKYSDEVRLDTLDKLGLPEIDLVSLKAANVVSSNAKSVKVINSGELTRAIQITGLKVTAAAKAAIEAKGGSIKE